MALAIFTPNPSVFRRVHYDPRLTLPLYVFDGRPLEWNADRTAVSFDSSAPEYQSDQNAVSSTALKFCEQSPSHMQSWLNGMKAPTQSQRIGTAVHARLLEPQRFATDYVLFDGRRDGNLWEAFMRRHAGKEVLNRSEWDRVAACVAKLEQFVALRTDDDDSFTVADLVSLGEPERVYYWLDRRTGLTCKARLDLPVDRLTIDLKTTDDARASAFQRQCTRLGYHIQAAFYLRARKAMNPALEYPFFFIAAELNDPYEPQIHPADQEEFIDFGDKKVDELLDTIVRCRQTGVFPGYAPPKATLKLPTYYRYPGVEP